RHTIPAVGHVFISYSHRDSAYVNRLAEYLTNAGIEVWTDRGIEHGAEWVRTIERRVRDRDAFVPVMSRSSHEAEWVTKEILLAPAPRKAPPATAPGGRRFPGAARRSRWGRLRRAAAYRRLRRPPARAHRPGGGDRTSGDRTGGRRATAGSAVSRPGRAG